MIDKMISMQTNSRSFEPFLNGLHHLLGGSEALLQDLLLDAVGAEQGGRYRRHPRVLAIEPGDGERRALPDVELEVDESSGKHKQVALLQVRREQRVVAVAGNEPHVQAALDEEQNLRGPRVHMRRVDAPLRPVDAHKRDALCVDARELPHIRGRHTHLVGIVGVARVPQHGRQEIGGHHLLRGLANHTVDCWLRICLRNAEVLLGVGFGGHGCFDRGGETKYHQGEHRSHG